MSHAGNRNDPLCPSDAVLHHFRGKNKGPEGGRVLPTGIPVFPILHMCHLLGTEMIHFVHQMQYYITFELRTRGLREDGAPYGYPGVPHTSHVSHAGNRNDPLCPSDAVLHHLRAKNKGPEGGAPYGYPGVPLHMCREQR